MRKNNENNVLFVLFCIKPVSPTQIIEGKAIRWDAVRVLEGLQYKFNLNSYWVTIWGKV
jgi:hypothetical protein